MYVTVALRMMIRRASMCDAEPVQGLDEPGRGKLRALVCGQRYARLAAPLGQPFEYGLLDRCQRIFGSATVREIPSHDLPRAAVDHT
ncbi:MAG TPA: hypothetical protein VHX49_03675, partial [Candidatus Acidoferrales bacterium]|nr:hypothetical protein [Candidatus Acidoferrales bacterium]